MIQNKPQKHKFVNKLLRIDSDMIFIEKIPIYIRTHKKGDPK